MRSSRKPKSSLPYCHYADHGAYTSSVSVPRLEEIGVDWAIIGHSEKRAYEGETSFDCNRKISAMVKNGFHAIYCVGETAKQYDEGITKDVIREQIVTGLRNLTKDQRNNVVIAYEPVWSIGTGKNASAEIAQDICSYIRDLLNVLFGKVAASKILILYGGSVKPNNVKEYRACPDIDGALVGGASLKYDSYQGILSSIMMSSSETVFYVLAVYSAAGKIKKTRYIVLGNFRLQGGRVHVLEFCPNPIPRISHCISTSESHVPFRLPSACCTSCMAPLSTLRISWQTYSC